MELGYSSITLNRLVKIAEILEVELADIICTDIEEIIRLKLQLKQAE
ncbi:hypothetical protein [Mucilaginibacter sp.]|nr:hypothetical protein [Mucilaginibacter sp.]MDR3693987.1 hypothetical protein [Mucilaginibacter sp.]